MKCEKHQNKEVVALCSNCNAGLCTECAQATAELRERHGTLCVSCYKKALNQRIAYYEKDRSEKLTQIIISTILYIFGLIMMLTNATGTDYISIAVGIFLCGFYSAISGWKKGEAEHNAYERTHGVSYTVTSEGIERNDGFFFKLLIAALYTVIGVVATPINIIKNIVRRKNDKILIENLTKKIARVNNI